MLNQYDAEINGADKIYVEGGFLGWAKWDGGSEKCQAELSKNEITHVVAAENCQELLGKAVIFYADVCGSSST